MKPSKAICFASMFAVATFAIAGAANACTAGPSRQFLKPLMVFPDGSFKNAGRGKWGFGSGKAIIDVGGQRIAQRIDYGPYGCTGYQVLLFVDCAVDQGVLVHGKPIDDAIGWYGEEIVKIQKPIGPISLTKNTTVEEVAEIAQRHGFEYSTNPAEYIRVEANMKRIDVFNGCKIFYPDSAGATG